LQRFIFEIRFNYLANIIRFVSVFPFVVNLYKYIPAFNPAFNLLASNLKIHFNLSSLLQIGVINKKGRGSAFY